MVSSITGLSVVVECSVKVFDDFGVFVTECQFGVSSK